MPELTQADDNLGLADATRIAEERIYRTVTDGLMSQRLLPGTKLPEASLASLFGVSRTVVRRVLQRLAHDHIVELRPNRGAVVAVPTPEETRDIFEARRALEAAVVALAVERASQEDLRGLRSELNMEARGVTGLDQPSWAALASGFHVRLAEVSGNAVLARYQGELISRCSLIVALYEPPGNASCEHDEHVRILDAIEKRDADSAVALMHEHLTDLERRVTLKSGTSVNSLAEMLGLTATGSVER